MENPSKTHARTALRGPGAGAPQRSTTTWSADHDGIDGLADAMDAGPDAAMPVVPVYEALKHGPAMKVTPLPDRVDQSQLGDAPVPDDQRQAEGHGRGGDEAVPRVPNASRGSYQNAPATSRMIGSAWSEEFGSRSSPRTRSSWSSVNVPRVRITYRRSTTEATETAMPSVDSASSSAASAAEGSRRSGSSSRYQPNAWVSATSLTG